MFLYRKEKLYPFDNWLCEYNATYKGYNSFISSSTVYFKKYKCEIYNECGKLLKTINGTNIKELKKKSNIFFKKYLLNKI